MAGKTLADLLPYLSRHGDVYEPDGKAQAAYVVASRYVIEYRGHTVTGVTGDFLTVETPYTGTRHVRLAELSWEHVHVYKRMVNW